MERDTSFIESTKTEVPPLCQVFIFVVLSLAVFSLLPWLTLTGFHSYLFSSPANTVSLLGHICEFFVREVGVTHTTHVLDMTDPGPALSFPALLSSSTTFCCSGVFAQRSDFLGEVLVSWFKSDHSVWSYVTHGRLWYLCQGKGGCTDYSQLFPVSFFSGQPDTWVGSWLPLTF